MRRGALHACLALGAAALAGGCSSEDTRPASFTYIYETVLQPSCATVNCHNSWTHLYGLRFESKEATYAYLTGVVCDESTEEIPGLPTGNFVSPGQPDRSPLVHLLYGDDVTRRMPPDRGLPQTDIELVERWILEGALCN